ncbi:hypothetical protein MTO96_049205, partial [Rhipicephalus appendiculatus]
PPTSYTAVVGSIKGPPNPHRELKPPPDPRRDLKP